MIELNREAADVLRPFEPNAVTDVTGFGLLGHAHELASRSGVRIVLDAAALPALPGALELAAAGRAHGRRPPQPRLRRPARREQRRRRGRGARLRPADRGRPARLAARRAGAVLEATFAARGLCSPRASAASSRRLRRRSSGSGRRSRSRSIRLGAVRSSRIALASCRVLFVVITSGAFVRLTGSGLGCENWPSCGDRPYPEQGFHAFVEFGNRMVALFGIVAHARDAGSRRAGRPGSPGWVTVGGARRLPRHDRADPARAASRSRSTCIRSR